MSLDLPPRFPSRPEGPLALLKRLVFALLKRLAFGTTNEGSPFDRAPKGLSLVHIAADTAQAEMLRDVLAAEGFHVEFVPTKWGFGGVRGSDEVYVHTAEIDAAKAFVAEYLSAAPEPGWEDAAAAAPDADAPPRDPEP